MSPIASRLSLLPESVITEMMRLAERYGAIDLASGYPDFDPPVELLDAAERAIREGYNQYSLPNGSLRFRQALAEKHSRFTGLEIDPETHITVTCGSTEAIIAVFMTILNPGDKVIVFSPFYENYTADALLSDADPIFVPLSAPDFNFEPDELRLAFQQGAKALILCNPSNPGGKVFSLEELTFIASLATEYDTLVVTDEVYEHIVYTPYHHTYLSSLPGMFERTLTCSSLSKTFSVTGWRLGYVIAPPFLNEQIRKVHDYLTVGAPTPLQEAAVTALRFPDTYYFQLQTEYTQRRRLFLDYLEQAGLPFTPPQGTYFVLVDISPLGVSDDTEFCHWMVREAGVAAVPGSSFFHEPVKHLVRLNFAKRLDTLVEAGERLLQIRKRF